MTYAQEQALKRKQAAKTAKRYRFEATASDLYDRRNYTPEDGAIVIKTQPFGVPKNGTMGQCYIADLDGNFIGMVDVRSLVPVKKEK